jgi:O-antigen/teichoic acid export membrane protein
MFSIVKSIAKHSLIYGVADVLSKSIGFLLIPLYTHYLTPSDYGTLELLDLTSYVVGMLSAMGIANSVVRYYYEFSEKEKKEQVISVAMITVWIGSIAIFIISVLLSKQISTLVFKSPDYYRFFIIIFAAMVFNLSNEIPMTILRIEQKSVLFVTISLIKTTLSLIVNIILIVYFGMGIRGILFSGLIVTGSLGIFLVIYQLHKIKFSYSFELLWPMLKYGVPLAWSTFGMFIVNFADRFFLQRLSTLSDVGIYSLAYRFGFLPSIIVMGPFLLVWAPKRFDLVKEPNAKEIYSVIFTYLTFLLLYTGLGICVMIKDIISIVADPKFSDAYKYVGIILTAYIFNGAIVYVQFGIHLAKKTKYLAYATLMAAGVNIGCNLLLIPPLHALGAAFATLISFLFLLIYMHIVSQKFYNVPYEYGRIIKMSIIALVMYAIANFINPSGLIVSMVVKFLIAFSFPFILYVFRFYKPEELKKISEIRKQIFGLVKARLSVLRG